jgi:hypothetical protein
MPARDNPWAVYDVFTVQGGEQIFLAAVSDAQWQVFCDALGFADLKADPLLATNNDRVRVRARSCWPRCASGWPAAPPSWPPLFESRRPALRADPPARGPVRRPAPAGHRWPGGRGAAGRRQGRADGEDHAVPDHAGRPAAGRAPAAAALLGACRRAAASAWATARRRSKTSSRAVAWPEQPETTPMHRPLTRRHLLGRLGAAGARWACPRWAQADKSVRFVLPNATGSGVDAITRTAQPALSKALGHPIVVDNQPGRRRHRRPAGAGALAGRRL